MATYNLVVAVASAQDLRPWYEECSPSTCVEHKFDGNRYNTTIKDIIGTRCGTIASTLTCWTHLSFPSLTLKHLFTR